MKANGRSVFIGRLRDNPIRIVLNNSGKECECACFKLASNDLDDSEMVLVKAFEGLTEISMKYLHQGDPCCVEGVIQERGEGKPRIIIAKKITFVTPNDKERSETC